MSIFCAVKVHNRVKCDHASEAVSFGACLEQLYRFSKAWGDI